MTASGSPRAEVQLDTGALPFEKIQSVSGIILNGIAIVIGLVFGAWAIKSYNAAEYANSLTQQSLDAANDANSLSRQGLSAARGANDLSTDALQAATIANLLSLLSLCASASVTDALDRAACTAVQQYASINKIAAALSVPLPPASSPTTVSTSMITSSISIISGGSGGPASVDNGTSTSVGITIITATESISAVPTTTFELTLETTQPVTPTTEPTISPGSSGAAASALSLGAIVGIIVGVTVPVLVIFVYIMSKWARRRYVRQ